MLKFIDGGVTAPLGYKANGIHCGIRKNKNKKDLALIVSDVDCVASAVYTKNLYKGAPLIVNKKNLANGIARAIICNSGIANTCAPDGIEKANGMAEICADALNIEVGNVVLGSTGVIGESLPLEPIQKGIDDLVAGLSKDGSADAAFAIMTTDTIKKEFAVEFEIAGKQCKIGAIAKGSGMINPNMATMLSYITSDVAIEKDALDKALLSVIKETYNMISVDGDTSTNDNVVILCNGLACNPIIKVDTKEYDVFCNALMEMCKVIAKQLAKDGEGATKLIECVVKNTKTKNDAVVIAKSIINSSLVKSAFFGEDANCGRILCAAGYSGVEFDVDIVDVTLTSTVGSIMVCGKGLFLAFDEEFASRVLHENEITITVDLHCGEEMATAWGTDLTYEYVKINGDYRT